MKAIVIGGGLAGLTTAIALDQRGIDFEVHEEAPELASVGAGIGLGPNAMHVFRDLGIDGEVRRRSAEVRRAGLYSKRGKPIRLVTYEAFMKGEVMLGGAIHRAELQNALLSRIEKHRIHLSKRFVSFQQDGNSVTACFEDGSSATGDLLIGADGVHSMVRGQIHPQMPLRYSGQTCWRGVADIDLPHEFRNTLMELWGTGERMGFIEIGANRVYWFAVALEPRGGRDRPGSVKEKLLRMFGDFAAPCRALIESTSEKLIIRSDLIDFKPLSAWYLGRACLIGDAAHATTPNLGQGGCQAVEDALALAICLKKYPDLQTAFLRFVRARSGKTRFVGTNSWRLGKAAHYRNRIARGLRDFVLKNLPISIERRQFHKIVDMSYLEEL